MPQDKSKGRDKARKLGKGLSALLGDSAVVATLGGAMPAVETPPVAKPTQKQSAKQAKPAPQDGGGADSSTSATRGEAARGESMVGIHHIEPGPWQPRRRFDDDELESLVESLKARGVIQPLLVRPKPGAAGKYQLIAGERRWRAAQKAGLHELPVLVRDIDDRLSAELALIENIQRHDLSPIEEATGYKSLMEEYGHTQEGLGKILGKSRSYLANTMRLLTLPAEVQNMVLDGRLSQGQVRPLVGRDDALKLARMIARSNTPTRLVEAWVRNLDAAEKAGKPVGVKRGEADSGSDPDIAVLERGLKAQLGLDVQLRFNRKTKRGRLTIRFASLDQFDMVVEKLK